MNIEKVRLPNGEIRWEVYGRIAGRGSKALRRRFQTKVEAEDFVVDFAHKKRNPFSQASRFEETTFQLEAEYRLQTKRSQLSPSHLVRTEFLMGMLNSKIGHLTPDKVTSDKLSALQDELLRSGQAPATVQKTVGLVRAVMRFSVKKKRIPYDPTADFEPVKKVRKKACFWEEKEAQSFLNFANSKYLAETSERWTYLLYLIALNTGLRISEILGLRPRNLVADGELIRVEGQFERVTKSFRPCKDHDERIVPCGDELRQEWLSWAAFRKLRPDDYLFAVNGAQPVDYNNLRSRYFAKDLVQSGLRRIRIHDLRHTAATLMISKGVDLVTVKEILGHSEIAMTQEYVHALGCNIRSASALFSISASKTAPSVTALRLVR